MGTCEPTCSQPHTHTHPPLGSAPACPWLARPPHPHSTHLVQVLNDVPPVNHPPGVPLPLVEHKIAEERQQVGVARVAGCGTHVRRGPVRHKRQLADQPEQTPVLHLTGQRIQLMMQQQGTQEQQEEEAGAD